MNNGGPAFPRTHNEDIDGNGVQDGMTLRDYFAAASMQALIPLQPEYENRSPSGTAREAYEYADAMLAAREETE